jgi:hypothetical protein
MTRHKSHSKQLLEQARHLATKETKRPLQVSLRRAISNAYYALFHFLIDECCRMWIGSGPSGDLFRTTIARAFEHGQMAEASKAFRLPILADKVFKGKFGGMGIAVPEALRDVAQAFVELQERRHDADYDLTLRFNRHDVLGLCAQIEQAMANWEQIRNEPIARLFMLSLLFWERMSKSVR